MSEKMTSEQDHSEAFEMLWWVFSDCWAGFLGLGFGLLFSSLGLGILSGLGVSLLMFIWWKKEESGHDD